MTTMNEPLADARDMLAIHTMFRREFGLMPDLVRNVAADDEQRTRLVMDHVAIVSAVLEQHHTSEDKHIWPRLLERCPEECGPLVEVMEDQHEAIHNHLAQVKKTAESWRETTSADTRDALADVISLLIPALTEHLALEEERVVPLIEKHITAAEYGVLAKEGTAAVPPNNLPTMFGAVMYEGDPAVIDMIVAGMPAEVQPVIRDLAAAAYAAYAKELYGVPAPPRVRD